MPRPRKVKACHDKNRPALQGVPKEQPKSKNQTKPVKLHTSGAFNVIISPMLVSVDVTRCGMPQI